MAATIKISVEDDQHPDDRCSVSFSTDVLKNCRDAADVQRVIGNAFLEMCRTVDDAVGGGSEHIEVDRTMKVRL